MIKKLCRDCKFCVTMFRRPRNEGFHGMFCIKEHTNLIDGTEVTYGGEIEGSVYHADPQDNMKSCREVRYLYCGEEGRLWEEKEK